MKRRLQRGPALLCIASFCVASCQDAAVDDCANLGSGFLLSNVQVIDGSGAPGFAASLRVAEGKIDSVGNLDACPGENVVDGGGLTLAPGFIDTHSHADGDIDTVPDALAAVSQGITTVVVGQDGGSHVPLADFFSQMEANPSTINFASYAGHNSIRDLVLGDDSKRVATDEEIAEMAVVLERDLAAGALGLATGLEYEPGIYSQTSEVIALAQVAADAGGRYISHMRSEDRWLEDSIDEIIAIGRDTGMPVQISHFKLAMTPLWGRANEIIAKLDAARLEGVQITADIYPYEYWQSTMMVLLPERDYTDRVAVTEALDTIAPAAGIWLTRFEPNPDYVGQSITEIANTLETDPVSAFMTLAEMADQWESADGGRAEMIIGTSMHEQDIETLMAWQHTNICSDGGLVDLHPRGAGSFPRVLGRYARERGIMSVETAVHKMSGLAATHMGINDRGLIGAGMLADLVLFDAATVIDQATPDNPAALSSGIHSVWVAGELVYTDGATTAARPGSVIRRQ